MPQCETLGCSGKAIIVIRGVKRCINCGKKLINKNK